MARNPTPHVDRLADQETGLADVNRELASRAHRRSQLCTFLQTWPAETREQYSGGVWSYPRYNDSDCDQLPVVVLESQLTGGVLSWEDRSQYPVITAYSPVGWLPPLTRVEIGWDGKRYRIIQAPNVLDGYMASAFTAAEWRSGYTADCRCLTLGEGILHVFEIEDPAADPPVYCLQYYEDGDPVYLKFYNIADEADGDAKGITVKRDRWGKWKVDVEPCELTCTPSSYT